MKDDCTPSRDERDLSSVVDLLTVVIERNEADRRLFTLKPLRDAREAVLAMIDELRRRQAA